MNKLISTLAFSICSLATIAQTYFTSVANLPFTEASDTHGAAWVDINKDGWIDIYLSTEEHSALYQNNGDGTFTKMENSALSNISSIAYSSVWGDYDNDSKTDAYISNWGNHPTTSQHNLLFRQGPGNFQFMPVMSPASQDSNFTWSSSWADFDNDGDIDLCVPSDIGPVNNYFYENMGAAADYALVRRDSLPFVYAEASNPVATWFDYDNDGDEDLLMATFDADQGNKLFRNMLMETGTATFETITDDPIVMSEGYTLGFSIGDIDNDGDLDVFSATWDFGVMPEDRLYLNNGDGSFSEITQSPVVSAGRNTLGSAFGDYDNDGDLDLYICDSFTGNNLFFQNDGNGNFTQLAESDQIGQPIAISGNAQNACWADYDNDGDLDLLTTTAQNFGSGLNYLFRNEKGNENNWLNLQCTGTVSNTAAIGAKVRVKATINGQATWQYRHISGSPGGDRAQNSIRAHFGLGDASVVDSIIISYPSGIIDVFTQVAANQHCQLTEGQDIPCELISNQQETSRPKGSISIHPNPGNASGVIVVYELVNPVAKVRLEVYNAQGQLLQEKPCHTNGKQQGTIELKTETWPAGLYHISIRADNLLLSDSLLIR